MSSPTSLSTYRAISVPDVGDDGDLERFCRYSLGGGPADPDELRRSRADQHWMLEERQSGEIVARCSLWWSNVPRFLSRTVGLLGHYRASDPGAAGVLLTLACRRLSSAGCDLAVGPMDGSTLHHYRLVTERGALPPFFLEPDNPDDWPSHFTDNDFRPLAHYYSSLQTDLTHQHPDSRSLLARMRADGVTIRSLNSGRFDDELHRIFNVASRSFAAGLFASPLLESEFVEQYQRLLPLLCPELVVLAERGDTLLGFLFAVPDWLEAGRGHMVHTVIVKTIAVLPEHAGHGLGTLLSSYCQETATRLGFTRAVHALMHESNISRRISQEYGGRVIRRYALFGRELEPDLEQQT
jgi:GNAT superfamily N-acetyltransferase